MFCEKCGSMIPDGSRFCENCGNPVSDGKTESSGSYQQNTDYSETMGYQSNNGYQQDMGYNPNGGYQDGGYNPNGGYQDMGYNPNGGYQDMGYNPNGGYQNGGYNPNGNYPPHRPKQPRKPIPKKYLIIAGAAAAVCLILAIAIPIVSSVLQSSKDKKNAELYEQYVEELEDTNLNAAQKIMDEIGGTTGSDEAKKK